MRLRGFAFNEDNWLDETKTTPRDVLAAIAALSAGEIEREAALLALAGVDLDFHDDEPYTGN